MYVSIRKEKNMSILQLKSESTHIREVWNDNLEEELTLLQNVVDEYPYVGMDTEFPGLVLHVIGNIQTNAEHNYQNMRVNVNLLKIIQLGLTFFDEKGNLPQCGADKYCAWQFNFREFNPKEDIYACDNIKLLSASGIDFPKNREKGIDVMKFSELFMSSGIVLSASVHWVTFHSKYDFGYLVKLLTSKDLPYKQKDFLKLVELFFPVLYDIKYLMKFCNLHGGLSKVAVQLGLQRIGNCHLAGSDSFLTSSTFLKIREKFFEGLPEKYAKYAGMVFGLGVDNYKLPG